MSTLFDLKAVDVHYGKVQALKACGLRIQAGERVALVAPTAAAKNLLRHSRPCAALYRACSRCARQPCCSSPLHAARQRANQLA